MDWEGWENCTSEDDDALKDMHGRKVDKGKQVFHGRLKRVAFVAAGNSTYKTQLRTTTSVKREQDQQKRIARKIIIRIIEVQSAVHVSGGIDNGVDVNTEVVLNIAAQTVRDFLQKAGNSD